MNNNVERKNKFTFALTNARSLGPKIGSLIDYFEELDISFALITETWLVKGRDLERNVEDLELGENIAIINKNRHNRKGGGVAILYRKDRCKLGEYNIIGNGWEIVAAVGKLNRDSRKLLVITAYFPPKMDAEQLAGALKAIEDTVRRVKMENEDPYIIIGGDMNRHNLKPAVLPFPDICLLYTSPSPRDS